MAQRKAAPKKTAVKKQPAKRKITALREPMTKSEIINEITENADLSKKQVQSVLDELTILIERHIKKRSAGKFSLPGFMRIQAKKKPATKARKGRNPFTGEEMTIKAKPARNVVKIYPMKKIKDMVL